MIDLFSDVAGKVPLSNELVRILQVPRRLVSAEATERLAVEMTEALRTPHGTMKLRPLQAQSLYEIGTVGGLFGAQRVGQGKTLISLLAPVCAFAKRPLLIVPAKLIDKTMRDREELVRHWDLPEYLKILSYEWLGRAQAAEALEKELPDMIILDECHKIRRLSSAVSRRFRRYFAAHPDTKCVALSGTITKRSLHDYAHLLRWAVGPEQMPLPRTYQDLEMWADALDERKGQMRRADPGALEALCDAEERRLWQVDRRGAARSAYRRRLVETAGVVASTETPIDATLTIQAVELPGVIAVDEAFQKLRTDWETPDGGACLDGLEVFRRAREISLGFFYRWDPPAPQRWREARKAWSSFVRGVLKHSRHLDSELQVRRAHPEAEELRVWQAVAPEFEPNPVPVWLDDSVLKFCVEWAERERGIVWTEHTCFGERLAQMGLTYYGKQGRAANGRAIEDHPPGEPLVASIQSNGEGRNLQAWSTMLITSMPAGGSQAEQVLGRCHREGQMADEVSVDVLMLCVEHTAAFWQSYQDSEYVFASTGAPQKLLIAGVDVPYVDDIASRPGPRWQK